MGETSTNVATLNMKDALKVRVQDGCDVQDPCASSPCPPHSRCQDTWDDYACVCEAGEAPGGSLCVLGQSAPPPGLPLEAARRSHRQVASGTLCMDLMPTLPPQATSEGSVWMCAS